MVEIRIKGERDMIEKLREVFKGKFGNTEGAR